MKREQLRMDASMPSTAKVLQGPGFASTIEPDEQPPTLIERFGHNAGYLTMPNLPPRKFFSWANIGNIMTILMAMAALGWFLWNTAIDVGVQKEQRRQADQRLMVLEEELRKVKEAEYLNQADEPAPTPKTRIK